MNTTERFGYNQAAAQMSSVAEMVAALTCDYDRLEELRDERANLAYDAEFATSEGPEAEAAARAALDAWDEENGEELRGLADAAGDCKDQDEAHERIEEDALSVEVRSDWVSPGEEMKPGQFRIVLCTGGPHVELRGELDESSQPCRVWMRYSDWGESGEYHGENFDHDALLAYCACFYFGE